MTTDISLANTCSKLSILSLTKGLSFKLKCFKALFVIQEETVRELEQRVKQQSVEVGKGNMLRQKVTQEKAQLEIQIASMGAELQEANRR